MAKYVIGPEVAIHLAQAEAVIRDEHHILAPTLLRSQMLSLLHQAAHRGEMTKKDARRRLNYARGPRIRLLGDRVLASFKMSHGRSPANSDGPTPLTPSTSL